MSGTKGHRGWKPMPLIEVGEKDELQIDMSYFEKLKDDAIYYHREVRKF